VALSLLGRAQVAAGTSARACVESVSRFAFFFSFFFLTILLLAFHQKNCWKTPTSL
jgi:hypothetical protein